MSFHPQFVTLGRRSVPACLALILCFLQQGALRAEGPSGAPDLRLYVSYAAKPDPQIVLSHDFCILDPAAEAPLAEGRAMGRTILARVRAVEVAQGSSAAQ